MTAKKLRWIPNVRMAIVAATLLCITGLAMPTLAARHEAAPPKLDQFMWGLAGQESGWNYYIRNPNSGAFGRYQVMPANWNSWSQRYLDRGWNDQSPLNQELVVRAKVTALYDWLGSWNRVAYWWLTGSTDANRADWTTVGKRYVNNVMSLMARAPKKPAPLPSDLAATTGLPVNAGDWRVGLRVGVVRRNLVGDRKTVGHITPGETVLVLRSEWGPKGNVLWIKVAAADGTRGWVSARRTLPMKAPAKPPASS